jgi:pilus assembly protein Flp/PilA
MRLPPLASLSRAYRGAALLEYSLLVGLIAVVSIGSVVGLGSEVSNTFSTTTSALAANMSQAPAASASIQYIGDFTAGRSAGGFGEYIGLMHASYSSMPIGTTGPNHDPVFLGLSIYESGSGLQRTALRLAGDTSEGLPLSSTLSCDGLGSISFSETSSISVEADHTRYFWDGHRFPLAPGNAYNCIVNDGS